MYVEVASKLAVVGGSNSPAYSQAVSMEGANAVQVDVTIFNNDATTEEFDVRLEGSNDLQNWEATSNPLAIDFNGGSKGYATDQAEGIGYAYVRLKYSWVSGSSTIILAAGINTAEL